MVFNDLIEIVSFQLSGKVDDRVSMVDLLKRVLEKVFRHKEYKKNETVTYKEISLVTKAKKI